MKAVIIGSGTSGTSAASLMKKLGYQTYILDEKKTKLTLRIENKLLDGLDILILSPGVSLSHSFVKKAMSKNIEVVGELEIGSRYLSGEVVAVTGTNGKTTTVSLISKLLENDEGRVFTGGNIGIAVSSFCRETRPYDKTVLEVSSFQLESINAFHPHISVILNLSSDHLNRHKTLENYINTKMRIFENQTSKDYLVLNLDDDLLMSQDFSKCRAEIYYFSLKKECRGCYLKGDSIYFNDGVMTIKILDKEDITLPGEHNISNVLATLTVAMLSRIDPMVLGERVKAFKGVSHRLEYVTEIKGVSFINDSKATNISSTIVAMAAMKEPTTLILGGSDKGFEFDELFENMPDTIKHIVVVGETKDKILTSAKKHNVSNVFTALTFKEAVWLSYELSSFGETVLLSPASASFDMFKNFEERGRVFVKIVREIEKVENRKVLFKKAKKV